MTFFSPLNRFTNLETTVPEQRLEPRVDLGRTVALPSERPLRNVGGWNRRIGKARPVDRFIVLALSTVAAVLYLVNINLYPVAANDEGVYVGQAWAVQHGHIAPYSYVYDHPPLGWVQLAFVDWLPQALGLGSTTVTQTRVLMALLVALVDVPLLYILAKRLGMRRIFAAITVLIFIASPLAVVNLRQVYLDSVALPWLLGAMVLMTNPRKRTWGYMAGGACFGVSVLSKETMLLNIPALAYLLWTRSDKRLRAMAITGASVVATLLIFCYPLFAILRKELLPGARHTSLIDGIKYQLFSRKGSGAVWQTNSDRHGLLHGWLFYDNWLIWLGLGAALLCLLRPRLRAVGLVVAVYAAMVLRPGGYLPAMFIIGVLPFLALAVAGVGDELVSLARRFSFRGWTALASAVAVVPVVVLAPGYFHGDRAALTAQPNKPMNQATVWAERNLQPNTRVIANETMFTDLVHHGWSGDGWHAIFYTQLDLDPVSAAKNLPNGWRSLDFVITDGQLLGDLKYLGLTQLADAIKHSLVIKTFGSGDSAVVIRAIEKSAR